MVSNKSSNRQEVIATLWIAISTVSGGRSPRGHSTGYAATTRGHGGAAVVNAFRHTRHGAKSDHGSPVTIGSLTLVSVNADAQALVVVDMQCAFVVGDHAVPDAAPLRTAVSRQLENARAAGCLVVHLHNDGPPDAPDAPGTDGWHLVSDVACGERIVSKTQDDGFAGTDLEAILRSAGASSVSICGVMSEMCVAATARGALQRGFAVVMARDAHATYSVPEQGPLAPGVPARLVSRVAEWSLGDEPVFVDRSSEVQFTRA